MALEVLWLFLLWRMGHVMSLFSGRRFENRVLGLVSESDRV